MAPKKPKKVKVAASETANAPKEPSEADSQEDVPDNEGIIDAGVSKDSKDLSFEEMEKEEDHQANRDAKVKKLKAKRMTTQHFVECKSEAARAAAAHLFTPEELQNMATEQLAHTKDFCAGSFVDYLERSRAQEMKLVARTTSMKSRQDHHRHTMQLVSGVSEKFNRHKAEVHYELLADSLMGMLIKFWRTKGDKRYAVSGIGVLRKHAQNIVKGKQKAKCLAIDVNFYEMRYKLTHAAVKGLNHQDERQERLRDFFKQYHQGQSKVDLHQPSSDGQLRLVHSNPKVAHNAFSKSLSQRQVPEGFSDPSPESFAVSHPPAGIEESSPRKFDTWKARNARGRASCGMDLSRTLTKELSKMTLSSLPPLSPLGRSGSSMTFDSPTSCNSPGKSPMNQTWSNPSKSPSMGGSATLTGGWGAEGRFSPLKKNLFSNEWLQHGSAKDAGNAGWQAGHGDKQYRSSEQAFRGGLSLGSKMQERAGSQSGNWSGSRGAAAQSAKCGTLRSLGQSRSEPSLARGGPLMDRNPFVSPWRGTEKSGSEHLTVNCQESPTSKYLRESELNCISPKLFPFVTGHSDSLLAQNQALNDCDLLAIGTMLPGKDEINEVDLCNNMLLTEKSLVPFLLKLQDQPTERLSLNHCLHYALPPGIKQTLDVVESLLTDSCGLKFLRFLDLSGIAIGMRTHVPLCQAIQDHPRLIDVRLADTGISGSIAKDCIGQLMNSTSIEALDLSWNSFSSDVFETLGERLAFMYSLKSLHLASCSSSQVGHDNPIAFFFEYLSRNTKLTHLDVSTNRISFRGALVLEDALEQHKALVDLTISNNPIGVLGMRCLLRLLSRDTSGLVHIVGDGVAGGTLLEALGENMQLFRAGSPGGSYKLNLARPYHRALLSMLYKSCERFEVSNEFAFRELSYSKGSYAHPSKDANGVFAVPQQGKLSFVFNQVSSKDGPLKAVPDDEFAMFLTKYQERARIKVGFKKIVPLLAYWKDLEGRAADQIYMLEALCKDFALEWYQIEVMCRYRPMITDILWRLMPSIIGGRPGCYIPSRKATNMTEFVHVYQKAFLLEAFNPDNATGHYKLNLENPSDFFVAEQLILLDRWETSIAQERELPDVSQKGNWSHVRNEKFQELPIQNVQSIMEWGMPEWDTLELDYASSKRPPPVAPNLDSTAWDAFLLMTQQAQCSQEWQVLAFRNISDDIYLTVDQLRQLLSLFGTEQVRQDVFVIFFFRINDIRNEKVCRVRFDCNREVPLLRNRLGHVACFPFIQPEQAVFEFDLTENDQRISLVNLLNIAVKESRMGMSNVHDFDYRQTDGTIIELEKGIPASWTYLDKLPTTGNFKCTYNCAPEERKILDRKQIIEQFGFWPGPSTDEEVNWWADIGGTPDDVIEFLDFLVMHYTNVYDAFTDIDGPDGNRNISKKEFEEGIDRMKCKKFKGKRKKERITNIFRYLDPSGEGQVSEMEWGVLDSIFKEIRFSIGEFVGFLDRTFDNLDDAWDFLDDDSSGSMDYQEFTDACKSIGFFGPGRPIFSYLDKDDEGTVSLQEFQVVRTFHDEPVPPEKEEQ